MFICAMFQVEVMFQEHSEESSGRDSYRSPILFSFFRRPMLRVWSKAICHLNLKLFFVLILWHFF